MAAGFFKCVKTQCLHLKFNSFNKYLSYVRNYHIHEPNFAIQCPVESCFRSYKLLSSLTSHLRRKHNGQVQTRHDTHDDSIPEENDISTEDEHFGHISENQDEMIYTEDEIAVKEIALFALKTQELNRLSDIATDTILENTHRLLQQNECELKAKVQKCIQSNGLDPKDIEGLNDLFDSENTLAASIQKLSTSYERNKYLKSALNMVVPTEIVLGEEIVNCKTEGTLKVKKHSFQYIPVLKVLEQLLNQVDILSQVLSGHKSSDGKCRDICDGDMFKPGHHPLFSVNREAIQLMLYYDDFEVANPLGAKAKVHKLGGFYWVLGNVDPKYISSLKMLNLVILCPVKWIKKYGMQKVLKPLMCDLSLLESDNGVELKIGNGFQWFEGTLSMVLADNLGSNGIGGFVESFSASRPCRFCMGLLHEFQTKFLEKEFTLRSREMYDRHAAMAAVDPASASIYGVKTQSELNNSRYFHVVDGLPSDIMHDVLEGVLPLNLKVMLTKFALEEKYFTTDELNRCIQNFPYGSNDLANKPSLINNLNGSNNHLRQSAPQVWCLPRLLPLMIQDLVPHNSPDWKLFGDLMKIVDIVFSPVISQQATLYLEVLIKEYLQEFKTLYPNINLIPKQHFMIHYPGQIRRNGPLVRQWCMRFEAKHHYFTRLAHGMNNFKNLPKTLATRHQRLQCYWLCEHDSFLKTVSEPSPGTTVEIREMKEEKSSTVLEFNGSLTLETKVFVGNWVVIHGVKYNKQAVIVHQHNIFPLFLLIEEIFTLPNGDILFCCRKIETLRYNRHFHSYEVAVLNKIVVTIIQDFLTIILWIFTISRLMELLRSM